MIIGGGVAYIYSYSFSIPFMFFIYLLEEIPTRKNFRLLPKNIWIHKIPTRKNFGPMKSPWHEYTKPRRPPTMARDPRNLAQSAETLVKFNQSLEKIWLSIDIKIT